MTSLIFNNFIQWTFYFEWTLQLLLGDLLVKKKKKDFLNELNLFQLHPFDRCALLSLIFFFTDSDIMSHIEIYIYVWMSSAPAIDLSTKNSDEMNDPINKRPV